MASTHSARKGHRQWLHEAATLRYEAAGGLPGTLGAEVLSQTPDPTPLF